MTIRTAILSLTGLLSCLCTAQGVRAQMPSADEACIHIANLLVEADYQEVARCYPALRDSLPPVLREMSEAVSAYIAGRPAESNAAIRRVVDQYSQQAGLQNTITLLNLAVYNFRAQNDYAGAARTLREMLGLLPPDATEAIASLTSVNRWMDALSGWPATTIRRPEAETGIPVYFQKKGRGEHIALDVRMNGHSQPFIFDTGCGGFNFVTEAAAQRLGIRTLADSVFVTGMKTGYAKIGVADSLQIGDITVFHPTFLVADPLPTNGVDSVTEAILGNGILRKLGEIRIEANRGRIVLPATDSASAPQAPNLTFSNDLYYLTCEHDGKPLLFQFDSGNAKSTLTSRFYAANSTEIETKGKKSTSTQGGFGGLKTIDVYLLPEFTLQMPLRPVTLHDVEVSIREKVLAVERDNESGSLGVDFLRACDAVTVDLQKMYVRTE